MLDKTPNQLLSSLRINNKYKIEKFSETKISYGIGIYLGTYPFYKNKTQLLFYFNTLCNNTQAYFYIFRSFNNLKITAINKENEC